jgi:hypothetical protein
MSQEQGITPITGSWCVPSWIELLLLIFNERDSLGTLFIMIPIFLLKSP